MSNNKTVPFLSFEIRTIEFLYNVFLNNIVVFDKSLGFQGFIYWQNLVKSAFAKYFKGILIEI